MKQIVAVRISIGLVSCQEEITGQQVPPGEPFKLKVGQQVVLQNHPYTIRLDSVADTRCDAASAEVCYGGVATLYLSVKSQSPPLDARAELKVISFQGLDEPLSAVDTVVIGGYAIELLRLLPADPTDDTREYEATLFVQ